VLASPVSWRAQCPALTFASTWHLPTCSCARRPGLEQFSTSELALGTKLGDGASGEVCQAVLRRAGSATGQCDVAVKSFRYRPAVLSGASCSPGFYTSSTWPIASGANMTEHASRGASMTPHASRGASMAACLTVASLHQADVWALCRACA